MNSQIKIFIFLIFVTVLGTIATYQYRFRDLVLIKQAENQINKNNLDKGFSLLDEASVISTRNKSIRKIIELNLIHDRHNELIPLLINAFKSSPSAEYLHYIIKSFHQTGNINGAYEYLENSNMPESLHPLKEDYLITLNIDLGNYQKAKNLLQQKLDNCVNDRSVCKYFDKEDPYHEMMLELANIFSLNQQPEEARTVYTKLLDHYPKDLEIKKRLGDIYIWTKEFILAAEHFKELYQRFPHDSQIRQKYIESLTWSSQKSELLSVLKTIKEKTKYKKTLSVIIDLNLEKGDLKEAEKLLKDYLGQNPEHLDYRLKLAEVLSWQSKFRESASEFETILEVTPENTETRRLYAQVLSWMGEHKKASVEIRKTLTGGLNE